MNRYKIGYLHHRDPTVQASNQAGVSSEVFLDHQEHGYILQSLALGNKNIEPTHSLDEAVQRGRAWIKEQKGTCLKTPRSLTGFDWAEPQIEEEDDKSKPQAQKQE
jgi:hypothetical protein